HRHRWRTRLLQQQQPQLSVRLPQQQQPQLSVRLLHQHQQQLSARLLHQQQPQLSVREPHQQQRLLIRLLQTLLVYCHLQATGMVMKRSTLAA
ncbi:unnamed protein product, partial [Rotaria sordida]